MKQVKLLMVSIFCWTIVSAQKTVNTQQMFWTSVNSTIRFSDRWGLMADVHMRRNNFMADPGFYFFRLGAYHWVNPQTILSAGYGHMWAAPSVAGWHNFSNENRVHEQIQYNSKWGKLQIAQRIRLEQRWQEKVVNDVRTGQTRFTNRVRLLWSFNYPLSKKPHTPALVLSDELMIQHGKEIVYNSFDQNRIFLGIRQPISKEWSFDIGYMQVYQQRLSGNVYDRNHTMRLFFYYNADWRKKHAPIANLHDGN